MDLSDTYYGMSGDFEDEQIEHVPDFNIPPNVQDTPIDATGSGNTVASTATRKKKTTSVVWEHFSIEWEHGSDGGDKKKARCNYCKAVLVADSSKGTGHLKRHMTTCLKKHRGGNDPTQTELVFNQDGSGLGTWTYDPLYARECLAKYIAQTDQPINVGDNVWYERLIQKTFNTKFK